MLQFEDALSDLKAHAEALILFANNIDGLLTCALRPSNVFGPGDTQLVPFLIKLAKSGCAKVWELFVHIFFCVALFIILICKVVIVGDFIFIPAIFSFIF